jgi:flagellar basal-body rod protein FlgB
MAFRIDPLIDGLNRVLDLRSRQHSLTATNLANADTPGFRAQVLDFERALEAAVEAPASSVPGAAPSEPSVIELEAPPWSVDGNSVVAERESARLRGNALVYEAVTKGLSRQLAMLRFAASDGRS